MKKYECVGGYVIAEEEEYQIGQEVPGIGPVQTITELDEADEAEDAVRLWGKSLRRLSNPGPRRWRRPLLTRMKANAIPYSSGHSFQPTKRRSNEN